MPIYTKTGDKGKASLFSNERVWKDSTRMKAYGTVDELNSLLGLASAEIRISRKKHHKYLLEIIGNIQNELFYICSSLADKNSKLVETDLSSRVEEYEQQIDYMTKALPELTNFILPGGEKIGATFHVARTVCRRAEREIVSLFREEEIDLSIITYINRLSDLLFTMARYTNYKDKKDEKIWRK